MINQIGNDHDKNKTSENREGFSHKMKNVAGHVTGKISGLFPLRKSNKMVRKQHAHFTAEEKLFRKEMEIKLKKIKGKDIFGVGEIRDYHVFTQGDSSVALKIKTSNGKIYVIKTRFDENARQGEKLDETFIEAEALKAREKRGVKVPKIINMGTAKIENLEIPFYVMEHISAPKNKEIHESFYQELGEELGKMTKVPTQGFGKIKEIKNDTFIGNEEDENDYMQTAEKKAKKLLTDGIYDAVRYQKVQKAINIVQEDLKKGQKPSLIHQDLGKRNIFPTKPITIFDPNPEINHPLLDVATSIGKLRARLPSESSEADEKKIIEGYERITGEKINKNILDACLILRTNRRVYSRQNNKTENEIDQLLNSDNSRMKKQLDLLDRTHLE